ncbi:MAG: BlaI/MecI/CopY family transcriptional regulator, partial [Planctomycetes bacterium]|nr:BlaI/MecI/CopY family transcriptional regulator [Planctomycetota bacterium]
MTDQQPTDRELEALKVLWDQGEATVREVCEAMNSTDDADSNTGLAYTTVLSLLQVMEQKNLVAHRREGKAYVYLPQVERKKTLRDLAGGFLERVFDGSLDEYLVHALGTRNV